MTLAFIDTLRLTSTFLATHARTLLRLTWFPVFILALSGVFFTAHLLPFLPALQSGNADQIASILMPSLGFIAPGLIVPLIMSATAATGVLRFIVLGEGKAGRIPIYVATGAPVAHVLVVMVLLSVVLFLAAVFISVIVKVLSSAVPVIGVFLPLFIIFGLTAIAARWLLAFPIAAVTGRVDLESAWQLTKPVYGRFIVLLLALVLLVFVVDFAANATFVPSDPNDLKALTQLFKERWPLITLASFASNLFATASFFTLLGIIYRLRMRQTERPRPTILPASQPDEPIP